MVIKRFLLLLNILWLLAPTCLLAQETLTISGTITSINNQPIPYATVAIKDISSGTLSSLNGTFSLSIKKDFPFTISISCIGFSNKEIEISNANQLRNALSIKLETKTETIDVVEVTGKARVDESFQKLDAKNLTLLPDASGGNIESLIKTQMGVASNNELSSQYKVRGGNFDENMVYVNDIEVYRPFLIRSGQQEGLSFVNPDLVKDIYFSAGGFDTKYDDKMSSVLDISYKKPSSFAASASASLLGGTVHAEGASKNQKLTAIVGSRYKTSKMLLGTLDTNGEYNPTFIDFQTYLTYQISPKWEMGLLGYFGQTNYGFKPVDRETTFGTLSNIKQLKIYFEGKEKDQFASGLGAMSLSFNPSMANHYKVTISSFNTLETESYDILGQYFLQDLDPSGGTVTPDSKWENGNSKDYGTYLDHARNQLNGSVSAAALKVMHIIDNHKITWETKYQYEKFDQSLSQWNYLDSSGYSLPYNGKTIDLKYSYKADAKTLTNRITAFLQDDYNINTQKGKLAVSGGLRANYWDFNNELLISPRAAITYEPEWRHNFQFRFATGVYYQSPLFKELLSISGEINNNIKAQKSYHFVFGTNYYFKASNRPFKLSTELYYKSLSELIPYNVDNVRIVYLGQNNAKGYATGLDIKLNGELVAGIESWATLSLMKTEENLSNDSARIKNSDGAYSTIYPGNIPRPTDQRINFSLFFQDYIPRYPSFKVHLNVMFGSGLPFGPPNSPRYRAILRMPPYRRVDIGFSKEITGSQNHPDKVLGPLKKLWIGIDVFNLLDISNTISYYWITDIRSQQYAVPNYLTSRRINLKIVANF